MKTFTSIATAVIIFALSISDGPKANARQSRCCYYNNKKIDCAFITSDNSLQIEWADGLKELYSLVSQRDLANRTYQDARGGTWEWVLHVQGNISLTNLANGNHILKPLRGCS